MGHAFYDVTVYARTNPEGEHICVSEILPDKVEDLLFYHDIAVCDNYHGSGESVGSFEGEGTFHGREKFCAAASPLALDEGNCLIDVFCRGGQRLFGHDRVATRKEEHIKCVVSSKTADEVFEKLLGDIQRKSMHGA